MTTDHEPALAVLEPPDDAVPEPAARPDAELPIATADADNRHVYVHALSWLMSARRRSGT